MEIFLQFTQRGRLLRKAQIYKIVLSEETHPRRTVHTDRKKKKRDAKSGERVSEKEKTKQLCWRFTEKKK